MLPNVEINLNGNIEDNNSLLLRGGGWILKSYKWTLSLMWG